MSALKSLSPQMLERMNQDQPSLSSVLSHGTVATRTSASDMTDHMHYGTA
jgi:hypothetical protein